MDLIDKYLGESEWKEFYNMAKDKSGKTLKQYEKKYGGYKYQAPHVQDALKKAKNFKDFERMLKKFNESKMPVTDYTKVGADDWIIYDEGTGEIQKIVKATKKAPTSQFVSSKSAAIRASSAATKMAWLFLKKNKGFSTLIKTVKNNEARSVPDKHQKKIAIDTVKNPMKGALLGGPSAKEAEEILRKKFGYSDAQIKKLKRG